MPTEKCQCAPTITIRALFPEWATLGDVELSINEKQESEDNQTADNADLIPELDKEPRI